MAMVQGNELVVAADPPEDEPAEEPEEDEDEEETTDPQKINKVNCEKSGECDKFKELLEKCSQRVNNATEETEETCEEEMLDLVHCIDHCAARGLFGQLK